MPRETGHSLLLFFLSRFSLAQVILSGLRILQHHPNLLVRVHQLVCQSLTATIFLNGLESVSLEILVVIDIGDCRHQRAHDNFCMIQEIDLRSK